MIDPHVHLRDWKQSRKETLAHGLGVALSCGVDEVFDMPNTDPVLIDTQRIKKRLEDARRCALPIRYHVYAGLTNDRNQVFEVAKLVQSRFPDVIGLKLFAGHSTGNMGLVDEPVQEQVYRWLSEAGYTNVVALHCEKESMLQAHLEKPDDFSSHSAARPVAAEVASIEDQIRLSGKAGFAGHLHICHLSSIESLQVVESARKAGRRISCAVTPHHALLSSEDAKDASLYAKMNPPLRSETERSALFAALLEGRIDWIETDHAPHTLQDKKEGASGIPGFSGLLLLVKALIEQGASEALLQQLLGKRVQQVFGLESRPVSIPAFDTLLSLSQASAKAYPYDSFANLRLR